MLARANAGWLSFCLSLSSKDVPRQLRSGLLPHRAILAPSFSILPSSLPSSLGIPPPSPGVLFLLQPSPHHSNKALWDIFRVPENVSPRVRVLGLTGYSPIDPPTPTQPRARKTADQYTRQGLPRGALALQPRCPALPQRLTRSRILGQIVGVHTANDKVLD